MEDLIQIDVEQKINKVRKVDKRTSKCVSSNAALFFFFLISIIDSSGEIFGVKNKTHI